MVLIIFKNKQSWEFPGGLVVKIWCFHSQGPGPGSVPSRETEIPASP